MIYVQNLVISNIIRFYRIWVENILENFEIPIYYVHILCGWNIEVS